MGYTMLAGTFLMSGYSNAFEEKDLNMVEIKGGYFQMGELSTTPRILKDRDESPQHQVAVADFRIGKYEVTFDLWDTCYNDGGCSHQPDDEGWGRDQHPVMNVTPHQISEFITWLNKTTNGQYRLPSEAEWEYAARGGTNTLYNWGNELGKGNANCSDCNTGDFSTKSEPVGSYAANAFGLYDMLGNIWEFTADCWDKNGYQNAPKFAIAVTHEKCSLAVARGGAWFTSGQTLRVSGRNPIWKSSATSYYGFRLAAPAKPAQVYFTLDSGHLSDSAKTTLDRLVILMKTHPDSRFIIEGHTDDLGLHQYNLTLSQYRADNAYSYLLHQGISADRMEVIAMGETHPLHANNSLLEREKNRTVRIIKN